MACLKFQGVNYYYRALPFGIPKAPGAFQRANMAVTNYCRLQGVKTSLYLDDRLFVEQPGSEFPKNQFLGILAIVAAGGVLALDKTNFSPKTRETFLGMCLDTEKQTIAVPTDKYDQFCQIVQPALKNKLIKRKLLERVRGKAVSFSLACPKMKLYIRTMTRVLTETKVHPDTTIFIDAELPSARQWF